MPRVDPDADARARFVQPFYLRMMRLNSIQYGPRLAADIVVAGRTASPADVISLLGSNWRERVMGAWFALLQADPSVTRPYSKPSARPTDRSMLRRSQRRL